MDQKIITLNNGVRMPAIGLGTWDPNNAEGAYGGTSHALHAGYRHLDCAAFYKNEELVGKAVREFLQARPDVRREDLFITTKVWNHLHSPEDVEWSMSQSLQRLGLDYVDLFLVHWPIATEKDGQEKQKTNPDGRFVVNRELTENPEPTWRAMEKLVRDGKTRAIGVSNWSVKRLRKLLQFASITPATNQVEIHPYFQQTKLVDFCLSRQIVPQAYSPLGSQERKGWACGLLLESPDLKKLAGDGGHDLGQLLIGWGLSRGYCVLPKSFNPKRIESNFRAPILSEKEVSAMNAIATRVNNRFVDISGQYDYDNFWDDEEDR